LAKYGISGISVLTKYSNTSESGQGSWRVQASWDRDDALIVLTSLVNKSYDASSKGWLEAAFACIILALVYKVSKDDHSVPPVLRRFIVETNVFVLRCAGTSPGHSSACLGNRSGGTPRLPVVVVDMRQCDHVIVVNRVP
jgi:hypothetical protein